MHADTRAKFSKVPDNEAKARGREAASKFLALRASPPPHPETIGRGVGESRAAERMQSFPH
eukprot:1183457-Pyramimonas_sp.AAC.1